MKGKTAVWFFAACFTLASLSLSASASSSNGNINYCLKYWPTVIRESRYHIGMDAPARDFMGQIEVESRCVAGITTAEGSQGLGCFMPDTAAWLHEREKELQKIAPTPQPLNPLWSIRAIILFDRWLYGKVSCQEWPY